MMESDNKLRQAIKSFLTTFYEVRRLVDFIEELPVRHEMKLLSYDNMTASKLTPADVENLYRRLTHSTLTEDINNGIMDDFPDEQTITNRLKHLKYSFSREDVFKIEDVDSAYGAEIPTTKILSEVMDYGVAYDYTNTVWGIYREWNLIIDCLNKVVSEIESEFLNPQQDTSTEQEQTINNPTILQNGIMQYDEVLPNKNVDEVLKLAISKGIVEEYGNRYKWIAELELLPYLCEKLYEHFITVRKGDKRWETFSGLFVVIKKKGKNKGEEMVVDAEYIRRQKVDWYKRTYSDKRKSFTPRRRKLIDDIIEVVEQQNLKARH